MRLGENNLENSICAGIVTYNPDLPLFERVIAALAPQVDRIYIYDNASENIAGLRQIISEYRVELTESEQNDGIAKALNELCKKAAKAGYSHILTLDHDTVICDGFVKSCSELTSEERVAIVCPRVHYLNMEVKEKGDVSDRYTEVEACMTSGSLMSIDAWQKVGGFDEKMFIDWVDNDICTNFRLNGFRVIRDNQVFMDHRLGNVRMKRFLFWKLKDFQYSKDRIYYIVRNGIYYVRKYGKHINLKKFKLINLYNRFVFFVLNFKDKEKRKSIRRGVKDGKKMLVDKFIYKGAADGGKPI